MKTQRQDLLEDLLVVPPRKKRIQGRKQAKTSGENSILIVAHDLSDDLILEIFSRLPAKSIARFQCLSKSWASNLRLPYFRDLHFARSSARPKLLFVCQKDNQVVIFSSPQPQNIDEKGSSLLAANHDMKVSYAYSSASFSLIGGLVFLRYDYPIYKIDKPQVSVICNPSTGQSMPLPRATSWNRIQRWTLVGYDPIEKQYKVLSMDYQKPDSLLPQEHQILTLGNGEPSWRRLECCISHSPHFSFNQICINGVLYYQAVDKSSMGSIIVCFDVRSEKFSFIKDTDTSTTVFRCATLINYNGKLGSFGSDCSGSTVCEWSTSIKLRVLEDEEKQKWSEHIYVLPALWKSIKTKALRFVGVTRTNEIVLSSSSIRSAPLYIVYYNTKRNTVRRVRIKGMEEFRGARVYSFVDYVEDLKLL